MIDGTMRQDRYGSEADIVQIEGEVRKPRGLDRLAAAFWDEQCPALVKAGVLKASDAGEFTALCQWWARYCKLSRELDQKKADDEGYLSLLRATDLACRAFDRLASRFGMSPVDRARLRADAPVQQRVMARKRG